MSRDLEKLKHGPAESGVEELLLKRWSPRSYADKPVSSADLTKIFTAAAWALGYAGDPTALPEPYQGMETAARTRKPLAEFVFSAWDKASKL